MKNTIHIILIISILFLFSGCTHPEIVNNYERDNDLEIRENLCEKLSAHVVYDFHEGIDKAWSLGGGSYRLERDNYSSFLQFETADKWDETPLPIGVGSLQYIENLSENSLLVSNNSPTDGPQSYYFANTSGSKIIEGEFDSASNFVGGVALVEKDNDWFFIDKEGKQIIDEEYDGGVNFVDGVAIVKKGNEWFLIDKEGNKTGNNKFKAKFVFPFSEGLALIMNEDEFFYIDKKGNIAIKDGYQEAGSFYEGIAKVLKDGERYFIDRAGNRFCSSMITDSQLKSQKKQIYRVKINH